MFPLLPDDVACYCNANTTGEPVLAREIRLKTQDHPKAYWLLGPPIASLIRIFVRLLQPKKVLELGTFTGYSTAMIYSELPAGSHMTTIERDRDNFQAAADNLRHLASPQRLLLVCGDGFDRLRARPSEKFDFILVDIDKTEIADNFELIAGAVAPGGVLIVDNALLKNRVLHPGSDFEVQSDEFNSLLAMDSRFIVSLLPARDGLNIALNVNNGVRTDVNR